MCKTQHSKFPHCNEVTHVHTNFSYKCKFGPAIKYVHKFYLDVLNFFFFYRLTKLDIQPWPLKLFSNIISQASNLIDLLGFCIRDIGMSSYAIAYNALSSTCHGAGSADSSFKQPHFNTLTGLCPAAAAAATFRERKQSISPPQCSSAIKHSSPICFCNQLRNIEDECAKLDDHKVIVI